MKKGYSVDNICYIDDYDIICVDNYKSINKVSNYWYYKISLNEIITKHTIGVWKIKKLN